MKLRIKGNSIRLRLSKPEVERLAVDAYLEEHTLFGAGSLTYTLQSMDGINNLSASFAHDEINVVIPKIFVTDWAENNVTGFDGYMPVNETDSLYILVEKDFKCTENAGEDQSDNYENPNKTC